jgi:hypothetical protein
MTTSPAIDRQNISRLDWIDRSDCALRQGMLKLLAIKDSDVRLLTLELCTPWIRGCTPAVAFSGTIPLVALYYGDFIDFDVPDSTSVWARGSNSSLARTTGNQTPVSSERLRHIDACRL